MITTNGAKFLGQIRVGGRASVANLVDANGDTVQEVSTNLDTLYRTCTWKNNEPYVTTGNQTGMIMVLGVGTTAPTAADYWLAETDIDDEDINFIIRCSKPTGTDNWSSTILDSGEIVFTYTFHNYGESAISVTEIGLAYLHTSGRFLVGRCVIPPRVIEPAETVTFSYVIDFN